MEHIQDRSYPGTQKILKKTVKQLKSYKVCSLSVFADNLVAYVEEDPTKSVKKMNKQKNFLKLLSEFGKVSKYKINIKKQILYISN